MDSWEALDLDDSDLLSLTKPSSSSSSTLLPCKRRSLQQQSIHNQPNNPTITTNNSNKRTSHEFSLSLEPCSQISRSSQSHSQPPINDIEESSKGPPLTTSKRFIPGPAGAVQAVMHRRALSKRSIHDGKEEEEISTQDYLKRVQVVEGEDEDFKMNPWLCAIEFLDGNDGGNLVSRSSLSLINSFRSTDRLPQVVAVVKSCTPNGFGDLIVTLKDPTGTIGASIHRNVVTKSDFGKDITVGSVLILQKVVVFSPSRSTCNLNITLRNVVKVIAKDCGPPTKRNLASVTANVHSGTELRETRLEMLEKATSASRVAAEEILNEEVTREVKENKALVDYSDRQCEEVRNGGQIFHDNNSSSNRYQNASSVTAKLCYSNCESVRTIEAMKQRQHLISKATLPKWTDEQLDELFAVNFDDDDTSLF